MTFRPRPYDPSREDKRTPAQKASTDRNFRIFRLRGLYTFAFLFSGKRREQMRKPVDAELKAMGAETQTERRRAELIRELSDPDCIPF